MIRRPPRSTQSRSSAASDVYKRQSWICPIGTLSEWVWQSGYGMLKRSFVAPRWLDIPLRALKYILLGLFLYVVVTMPVPDIRAFLGSPYGMVADVKMLNFFREMGQTTAIVLAVLVVASLAIKNCLLY